MLLKRLEPGVISWHLWEDIQVDGSACVGVQIWLRILIQHQFSSWSIIHKFSVQGFVFKYWLWSLILVTSLKLLQVILTAFPCLHRCLKRASFQLLLNRLFIITASELCQSEGRLARFVMLKRRWMLFWVNQMFLWMAVALHVITWTGIVIIFFECHICVILDLLTYMNVTFNVLVCA